MSNSTIFSTRSKNNSVSVTFLQKMRQFTMSIRRRGSSSVNYLDSGHLDDHVLKDIGLDRSDLANME